MKDIRIEKIISIAIKLTKILVGELIIIVSKPTPLSRIMISI